MQLDVGLIKELLDLSLKEDYAIRGDITSNALLEPAMRASFEIVARQEIILSGIDIVEYFLVNYSSINFTKYYHDGEVISAGDIIISGEGIAHHILLLERVMLNYLQHLSGIATMTARYVQLVQGTKARICDTRKTIPNLRLLQKYAVRCGGGHNHRLALDSSILIKDNHIELCGGSVELALAKAREANVHYGKIEIECDTIAQVHEAVRCRADIIMLDNMNLQQIKEAMSIISGSAMVEVSGNISLDNVQEIARLGVDIISIGRLTHSVMAVDLSLQIKL